MSQPRRFPKPWAAERIPGGYLVKDANAVPLAYVYGDADLISVSEQKLTTDEARRISKLIAPLPELVELEREQGQESKQATAAPLQTDDDRRPEAGPLRKTRCIVPLIHRREARGGASNELDE
jgi:hypothetical protein